MAGRVEGKVCIVTGAASGIGRGCALRLAEEGGRVVLADVSQEAGASAAKELGGEALFVHCDVADEASWKEAIGTAMDRFGRLDVLLNNAGIMIPGDIESGSVEDWRRIMDVNALGVFLGCKHAIPAMRRGGSGSIVNISSTAGLIGTPPYAAYSASKGAVRILTKSVALHCKHKGDAIRCNSIHPGGIDTPMVHALWSSSGMDEAQIAEAMKSGPGGPFGEPRDIAAMVLFLASDESRFVTGAELVVDGGLTAG